MINNTNLKIKLIGLAILIIVIIAVVGTVIFSVFKPLPQPTETFLPTPTSVPTEPVSFDSSHITPLQKTTIGRTTDDQLLKNETIISKTSKGNITIYKVKAATGIDSEIRTQQGKVIFESTSTEIANPPPPKINNIKQSLGEPELTQKSVGVGWYTDAYLYPSQGLVFFANSSTGTVYLVQRFTPMSVSDYRSQYPEFLQKKVSQPEYFK